MNLQISPLDKLNGFLERLDGFKKSKVSLIKSGHNREIFLIEVAKKKYVAYVGHHKNDGGSSVKNEALVLSFLGSKGIDFVPKFVHYSNQLNILIVVFIPGKHIDFKSISDQDVYIFAKQLVLFHQISIKEFNTFCKENNLTSIKSRSEIASLKLFGSNRFSQAKKTCPARDVLTWIEPRLLENIENVKGKKGINHLIWGDIGNNLLKDKKKLFFIDFEFVAIGYSSELTYIKIHSHLKNNSFKRLVKAYANYSEILEENLYSEIAYEERIIRLNDVIWAAMKWGEYKNTKYENKYKKLTYLRMKLFEKYCSKKD